MKDLTFEQSCMISQAIEKLDEARTILDQLMYGSNKISNENYPRVRKFYDAICTAEDIM